MAIARYTRKAEADLAGIAAYTRQTWGGAQESKYLKDLEDCCERLAQNPLLGRVCDEVRPGLRRIGQGRHVVFYRLAGKGILVVRVLHEAMLPSRWSMEDSR